MLAALCLLLGVVVAGCGSGSKRAAFANPPTVPPSTPAVAPSPTPTTAPSPTLRPLPVFANAVSPLDIPTYEGSGQSVHPDVVYFPDGWRGHKYWMAMTPHPNDTDTYENPSIVVSDDGLTWSVPDGLTNPIIPQPACDRNSDPDIVYSPRDGTLHLYYTEQLRADRCRDQNSNSIRLVTSVDGVNWSAPQTVMTWNLDTEPLYLSPAVVYVEGVFHMWLAGSAGSVAHTTSSDGVRWTPLEQIDVSPAPWHLDVAYADGGFVMLIVDSPVAGAHVIAGTSEDGISWSTRNDSLISPGSGWDDERIYRSTLLYDGSSGLLRVWYSARSSAGQWHIGYTEAAR
jgi:predicted GH43/DUF377 family glycosyl hydrolase